MKPEETMAAKFSGTTDSPPQARVTPIATFGTGLAARRAALGEPELPRNSGKRRTESKTVLLRGIADAGGDW